MKLYIKIADKLNGKKTTITHTFLSCSSAAQQVQTLRAMLAFFLSHSNARSFIFSLSGRDLSKLVIHRHPAFLDTIDRESLFVLLEKVVLLP